MSVKVDEMQVKTVLQEGLHNDDSVELKHKRKKIQNLAITGFATFDKEYTEKKWLSPYDTVKILEKGEGDSE